MIYRPETHRPLYIKAVLFDFDGTLTHPDALDFKAIRSAINCPDDTFILEFIRDLSDPKAQRKANAILDRFEEDGAVNSRPIKDAEDFLRYLKAKGIKLGIVTRNRFASVARALENFDRIAPADFDVIITRDDTHAPKPSPEGIMAAIDRVGVKPYETVMVGDVVLDIEAGRAANTVTVFFNHGLGTDPLKTGSDFVISSLADLKSLIRLAIPLPAGKFPNELLGNFLENFSFNDPSVIVNPGIGEDIAAVDVVKEEVLILKSDPITFATDAIGQYAVLINANDIATSGAVPRWLLTTLLFPCGMTASQMLAVMEDLKNTCRRWNITLCGGHTEITDAVTRPVVSGTLAGTVARKDLIDKGNIRPGDRVLLTKGVAVEGTTIIAREFGDRLLELGMEAAQIETCRGFLENIGILEEARIAASEKGTSAMHDVTEGGLATALTELSIAGDHGIRVYMEKIPIYPETEKIGRLMGIDPLGLIGSGSLLICCREEGCQGLLDRIREKGIDAAYIGEVIEGPPGIEGVREGKPAEWPVFETDELTRLF